MHVVLSTSQSLAPKCVFASYVPLINPVLMSLVARQMRLIHNMYIHNIAEWFDKKSVIKMEPIAVKMEPTVELEDGTQSVDINYSTDVFLWKDVCQATAWFDRAQKLFGNTSTVKTDPDIVIDCAQKALSLYQGCFAKVKKRSSTASAAVKSRSQDPPEMGIGINLELRIAQTLRLLAAVHAALLMMTKTT